MTKFALTLMARGNLTFDERFVLYRVGRETVSELKLQYTSGVGSWSERGGVYRGASRIRNCLPVGPYSRPIPRALQLSQGRASFL